jgi:hypothetical protein
MNPTGGTTDETTPRRVQLRRSKGWRMPPNTVKVDRSTRYGNPFRVGDPGIPDAQASIAMFRRALDDGSLARSSADSPFRREHLRAALRGRNLACWCPLDAPCHADALLEIANS